MREHVQHDRPPESVPSVADAFDAACTAVEEAAEAEAARDATAALDIPHTRGAVAIASATDRLLTRVEGLAAGVELIPACRRGALGVGALGQWKTLKARGPAPDPLGTWSYMRDLAHVTRDMVRVLQQHRTEQRSAFVGRPDMPPLTPDAR
ncbi:hypothetical protein AB0D99_10750 [Streptomyces sp. NPDC047971]|uniref:hypothetical protein n=1 Tax=Streptomyces sp. NPDC047971 TaxID=3154499 RepID=UPI0033F6B28C